MFMIADMNQIGKFHSHKKKVKLRCIFDSIDAHISVKYGNVCRCSDSIRASGDRNPGGRDFPLPSRTALVPTQPLVNWYWVTPGGKTAGAWRWPPTSI